jgi:hypothetical protein
MEEVSQSLLSTKNNNNQMQKGAIDFYFFEVIYLNPKASIQAPTLQVSSQFVVLFVFSVTSPST